MSAKLFILLALVAIAFQFATVIEARNAPPMTRIQEVFRSLMAPEEVRGKKYYQQYIPNADQYITEW
ncbi:hypothetical protein GCK72_024278 [Caenorhabditis remanei]|uniref:Uncharacterized protein n=2 Tax=Caenorhabditis remanei TaxID=31234 RepID=E3LEF6_CAERE|nr:hypothetical protein GCK72_024278 [Caenorhabditis remanei]EFO82677.1 hypothetical protein CRE_00808 [Caenorhabditis remanei]KAF1747812.1 hypothetical protein GCK72_024278 [Caenorhabditis remanei]